MASIAATAEDRFAKLGLRLPEAPTPFGAYVPAVPTGDLENQDYRIGGIDQHR